MATDAEPSRGQEYAERPKEGELWQEMIERQRREGNNQSGDWRELLRSLPQEQQKDNGRGRGDLTIDPALMAEIPSFEDMLREASQRAVPDQGKEMER
jgi:hypothetical protein